MIIQLASSGTEKNQNCALHLSYTYDPTLPLGFRPNHAPNRPAKRIQNKHTGRSAQCQGLQTPQPFSYPDHPRCRRHRPARRVGPSVRRSVAGSPRLAWSSVRKSFHTPSWPGGLPFENADRRRVVRVDRRRMRVLIGVHGERDGPRALGPALARRP